MTTDSEIIPARFKIGDDLEVARIGLGAMRLTAQRGSEIAYPSAEHAVKLLRCALELGINLIDTAEIYGGGANESLIAEALKPLPAGLVIATKGGLQLTSDRTVRPSGSPEQLRASCERSLRRLGCECIDLYQLHHVDPMVPLGESVAALAGLRAAGKIRHIGLSNVHLKELLEAVEIAPIVSVQNRYNALERRNDDLLDYCAENRIAFLAWGPLGGEPMRSGGPLGAPESPLSPIALAYDLSTASAALLWLLQRAPNVIAIPGTTSLDHLRENASVLEKLL